MPDTTTPYKKNSTWCWIQKLLAVLKITFTIPEIIFILIWRWKNRNLYHDLNYFCTIKYSLKIFTGLLSLDSRNDIRLLDLVERLPPSMLSHVVILLSSLVLSLTNKTVSDYFIIAFSITNSPMLWRSFIVLAVQNLSFLLQCFLLLLSHVIHVSRFLPCFVRHVNKFRRSLQVMNIKQQLAIIAGFESLNGNSVYFWQVICKRFILRHLLIHFDNYWDAK